MVTNVTDCHVAQRSDVNWGAGPTLRFPLSQIRLKTYFTEKGRPCPVMAHLSEAGSHSPPWEELWTWPGAHENAARLRGCERPLGPGQHIARDAADPQCG